MKKALEHHETKQIIIGYQFGFRLIYIYLKKILETTTKKV